MDLDAVVAGGIVVVALLVALRAAGAGADLAGGLLKPPPELGWPVGVQEDDDMHWSWTAGPPSEELGISELARAEGVVPAPVRYPTLAWRARS